MFNQNAFDLIKNINDHVVSLKAERDRAYNSYSHYSIHNDFDDSLAMLRKIEALDRNIKFYQDVLLVLPDFIGVVNKHEDPEHPQIDLR